MTSLEIIKDLCDKKGISISALEKELEYGNGSLSKAKKLPAERVLEISKFFGVPMEYIMTGDNELKNNSSPLTKRDEKDIAKDLENVITKLRTGEDGPASFDGTDIPEADQELFAGQIELMLRRLKAINKEKYNPNKNKK